ncbi:MAG: NAD(P)H-hydrate dehydratase [Dehalococcoidia bacterium]
MKLVTAEQMRALEQRAEATGVSIAQLMENAGLAVAQEAWMLLGTLEDRVIVVLTGPGNNGGDGLVAARHLYDWGADVRVYLTRRRPDDMHLQELSQREVPTAVATEDPDLGMLRQSLTGAHLVIDALLGTGQARPIEGVMAQILDALAAARRSPLPPKLLAVDLPSGLNADTGAADPHTAIVDETVTLGLPKVGLYSGAGVRHSGRVQTIDIGIPAEAERDLSLTLLTAAWTRDHLPKRPSDANKGSFGKLLTVAGSINYIGAAYLCSAAAYRAGAGLVTMAVPRSIQLSLVPLLPEATFLPLSHDEGALVAGDVYIIKRALPTYDVLLVGPGIGQTPDAQQFVRAFLHGLDIGNLQGVVVDADALNALAGQEDWPTRFTSQAVMTPHPGEFARLARLTVAEVQANRLGLAVRYAEKWNKIVVLKGANTVIAAPDGTAMLSPFANPALATAGTGDVLAGAIAGLMAQGLAPFDAAAAGVYLHGAAGELMSRDIGDAGGLAGDLLKLLPEARREILQVR